MTPAAIAESFRRFHDANPHPTTELEYASTFELLVAVILSAQATDKGVNKATRRLFPVANTPAALLALGEDGLKDYIKTIGLYNNKATNILKTCQILLDEHGGEVPANRAALEKLPGVGRKTANVVLGNAFGRPAITVDTHVGRLSRRLGWTTAKDPVRVERDLSALWEPERWTDGCHRLIEHGRAVCGARAPRCGECVLLNAELCPQVGV